ncbi:hypothetical protein [Hoylesella shahii]|uniref:hypothetical protein n=1 Tax=Hoylesella shahii TaxID=228603 RepID=UPI0028E4D9C4|nr:hypothetical protein [Hoylesella shahii]
MDANEFTLSHLSTRLRQLILQYKELEKKNAELQAMVNERDERIKELDDSLQFVCKSYESLKMAKMVEITDGDMESAQKRLSKLIRDVNKCITLLSENSIDNG